MSFESIDVHALAALLAQDSDVTLIDVRNPDEYAAGHVGQAVNIPMSVIPVRVAEIPRDKTTYYICAVGGRSGQVCAWLAEQGYPVVNIDGGTMGWAESGYPVVI
jgi:rhodanese-related sulfurtransferase